MATFIDYLLAFMPIAAAHIAIPPISFFAGERLADTFLQNFLDFIYSIVPVEKLSLTYVRSLMYDTADWPNIKSTIITHMFVHADYKHLMGNLNAAFQLAFPVYEQFGAGGLYLLFISGGAIASFPSFLHEDQKRAFSNLFYDKVALKPKDNSLSSWIPGGIRNIWNMTAANTVASMMGRVIPTVCCGSSGACCALSGCTLTLLLRDCFCLLRDIHLDGDEMEYYRYNVSTTIDSNGEIVRATNGSSFTPKGIMYSIKKTIAKFRRMAGTKYFRTVIKLLSIYQIVQQFSNDFGIIHPSYSGSGSEVQTFWKKASSLAFVGHASHLQGTLYGAAYGCLFGIIMPSLRNMKYI